MKAIIRLGYEEYVVPVDKAMLVMELMVEAERYEQKGYGDTATFHIWSATEELGEKRHTFTVISEDMYRVAKLAGKPKKD